MLAIAAVLAIKREEGEILIKASLFYIGCYEKIVAAKAKFFKKLFFMMRSSVGMRSSRVAAESGCQCQSHHNSPGFDPQHPRRSGI